VREREREREREKAVLFFLRSVFLASNETVRQPYFLVSSVKSKKCGKARQKIWLFCPLVMLDPCRITHWKDT
jgi:hypothetical protein